ncbi:MAG: S41 family peptidase [Candidatus Aminicenantales bacterium]
MKLTLKRFLCVFLFSALVMSSVQAEAKFNEVTRLAALAKVWGFLKYYHNKVAEGKINWDQVLAECIPRVKQANDKDAFNHEILMMIRAAGSQEQIQSETIDNDEVDFSWMDDASLFYPLTSALLKYIRENHKPADNYYVQKQSGAGNTVYTNEKHIVHYPSVEYRLLALFRYWNIIYYFFPYKDVMDQDWSQVLDEFIPKVMAPEGLSQDYHLAIREMTARINDGHSFTYSNALSGFWGTNYPPFQARWIEEKTVVVKTYPVLLQGADLQVGDIITHVNGQSVEVLRQERRKYVQASNESVLQYNLCSYLFRSNRTEIVLRLDRGSSQAEAKIPCYTWSVVNDEETRSLPNVSYSILPGNIGYVHMGLLQYNDVANAMNLLQNTRAIVFDIRNYPNSTLYLLSEYLNPQPTDFYCAKKPDLSYPGRFYFTVGTKAGPSADNPDYYKGRVVILVNEMTISHAEFTTMALETAPAATVIGSQTAGADGNVSSVILPGNITTSFSGIGIFYPDRRPTQRIGIVPDIVVRPTVAGICAGRDEELERALEFIETGK